MKVAQVAKPNTPLEIVERDVPEPKARQVRIKVQACGVCHSDMLTVVGAIPGIQYPRVPGHEVVGLIDAVGADVPDWKKECVSAWVGMVVIAATASRAGVAIF
jgi:D-arabinose 1-dehydrogenase-like Zn-dependent alcohol dehydrogenase